MASKDCNIDLFVSIYFKSSTPQCIFGWNSVNESCALELTYLTEKATATTTGECSFKVCLKKIHKDQDMMIQEKETTQVTVT